jgi:hypothetical protein
MLTLGSQFLVRVGGEWNGRRRRDGSAVVRVGGEGNGSEEKRSQKGAAGSVDKEGVAGSFVRVWERRGEGSRWCGSLEKGAVAETLIGMRDERLEGDERDERESLNERNNYQKGLLARSFLFRCKMINVGSFR